VERPEQAEKADVVWTIKELNNHGRQMVLVSSMSGFYWILDDLPFGYD